MKIRVLSAFKAESQSGEPEIKEEFDAVIFMT